MATFTSATTVQAPPSKSCSHRAVICAGLALGRSTLSRVLESEDLSRTLGIVEQMGARVERLDRGSYAISGVSGTPAGGGAEPIDIDVGESGTTCRLITAVLAAGNGQFRIFGSGRMHDRPIAELADALASLGADIEWEGRPGFPPFVLRAAGIAGERVAIGLNESSQYLSGLLLAAPIARRPLTIEVTGSKVVSWPYVGLTLQAMEDFGISFSVEKLVQGDWVYVPWHDPGEVEPGTVRFKVSSGMYMARDMEVEGDWSNASYLLAAGAVGAAPVAVGGLRHDSMQGDRDIVEILTRMGGVVLWEGSHIMVRPSQLTGVDVDMGHCPDLVPTVAVLAALASGHTRIRNVAHLRIKESDRLAAVATELSRIGCKVTVLEDGLEIEPGPIPAGREIEFTTYDDHRLAMCLSILELAGVVVKLDNPGCVAKSFPGFWDEWAKIMACRYEGPGE